MSERRQARNGAVPLRVVTRAAALPEVAAAVLAGPAPSAPGAWAEIEPATLIAPAALATRLDGRLGGPSPAPDAVRGLHGARQGPLALCRVREAFFLPRFGAVIDEDGQVFGPTVGETLSWNPDLAALPGVRARGEARLFTPPRSAPSLAGATVFVAKGGEFNYGHFLLDCLPALLSAHELGLTSALPPLAPPLKPWSRDLLAYAFPDLAVRETRAPVVRLEEAAFSTAMNHFLHHPTPLLTRLRARILAGAPAGRGAARVYISRRAYPMRVMVNEPALEAALAARGFHIVRAERVSVAEQIALMREAEVVVGATGAGLANALFAPEGAKVFEIQPETFTSTWLRDLTGLTGADWHGYFCPAPVRASEAAWTYRIRRGFRWAYRLPLEDFLGFLDARL